MKPWLSFLQITVVSLFLHDQVHAQSIEKKLLQNKPGCEAIFANALELLPGLTSEKAYDSVSFVIYFIEKNCGITLETFNLKVLLAIETGKFRVEVYYDASAVHNLELSVNRPFYPGKRQSVNDELLMFYNRFKLNWANALLANRRLDINELLVCNVLAGRETAPGLVIMKNRGTYPYLYEMMRQAKVYERKSAANVTGILGGYWFPTNNLAILGNHPSIGLQFGQRRNLNEIDITLQFRFLKSANTYTILRNAATYERTNFFGGYIGLDYSRYFLFKNDYELGWVAGAGYDGFDISSSPDEEYLKPWSIGSLNVNTGIRFNYFYGAHAFIGLLTRYNIINYKNRGGSSLNGGSFSFDLIVGFTN